MRKASLMLVVGAMTVSGAGGAIIEPTFQYFGALEVATFGGTDMPNDAVAVTTYELPNDGGVIVLGLAAHGRYEYGETHDNAGTYTVEAGWYDETMYASIWNFDFYVSVPNLDVLASYSIDLLYDFDANPGTDETDHGVWSMSDTLLYYGATLYEDSQNCAFDFLADGVPGFIVPPPTATYDPIAEGEYTFALVLRDVSSGGQVGRSAIRVNAVPDVGSTLALMLTAVGSLGLGIRRLR